MQHLQDCKHEYVFSTVQTESKYICNCIYIYKEREHSMSCIIRGSVFKNGEHSWDIYL